MPGLMVESEVTGEGTEAAVRDFIAQQSACQSAGVHRSVGQRGAPSESGRLPEEGEVETHVVADQHRITDKFFE